MGEDSILTEEQKLIFDEVRNSFLRSSFYFTGGTALSEVYLKHRESLDLDFFSEKPFDPQSVFTLISSWSKKHNFSFESQYVDPTHIYILTFGNKRELKVDFAYYPYKRLQETSRYQGMEVESPLDIAVNKLLLISSQRVEVKDFVDLFFLLKKFSIWDLIEGVKIKFNTRIDPFLLASDFTAVEDFEFLPKMIKPLTAAQLKTFFKQEAKKLGKERTS